MVHHLRAALSSGLSISISQDAAESSFRPYGVLLFAKRRKK